MIKLAMENNLAEELNDLSITNEEDFKSNSTQIVADDENHMKTSKIRVITEDELKKLENDKITIAEFKKNKIEKETAKNWDLFYKRNKANFFKNRYWTLREFEELDENFYKCQEIKLLEIGCGVGNFLFPLLKINEKLVIYACDFAAKAIELLKTSDDYKENEKRCFPFVCDLVKDDLNEKLCNIQVDIVTLIFLLSALHPKDFDIAIKNIYKVSLIKIEFK
jgi:methyltransferase-like protein 6